MPWGRENLWEVSRFPYWGTVTFSWSWAIVLLPGVVWLLDKRLVWRRERELVYDSFHLGVDFSTHFFASPQPAEKSPHRVNILSPRIQFKMVDVITWPPKEGFLLILKAAEAVFPMKFCYFLCSFPQNLVFISSSLINHFSAHFFSPLPQPCISFQNHQNIHLSSCICCCIYYIEPSLLLCFIYLASTDVCPGKL